MSDSGANSAFATAHAAGLTYDRLFGELPAVPFRDQVWPKFLRENAQRAFKLPAIAS